jgi:AcrR family transcriptional regulator
MTPAAFDDLLHDCLDERRDPFADDLLCAYLDAHPDQLERVADLRARLLLLPQLAAPQLAAPQLEAQRARPRRRPVLLAAAGLASAAALALAFAWPHLPVRADAAPAPGRVLSASLFETPPRAYAAVSFTVREVLAAGPGFQIETYRLYSLRR